MPAETPRAATTASAPLATVSSPAGRTARVSRRGLLSPSLLSQAPSQPSHVREGQGGAKCHPQVARARPGPTLQAGAKKLRGQL